LTALRSCFRCCVALVLAGAAAPASAVVFSGEVRAEGAQSIFTPPSDTAPVVLRFYVPDGTPVKSGDVLLRIDAGQAAAQIRVLDGQIEQARAKVDKETAELRLKQVDAETALIDAQAARDSAQVDASIPPALTFALKYDGYRAEFERAQHDAVLKQKEVEDARAAVGRRARDGTLEIGKLQVQKVYYEAQVAGAEVRAEHDGTVVHGFSSWLGTRIDEGSSSFPGQEVGTVVSSDVLSVRAWILEPDRARLAPGQALQLDFDALPGRRLGGKIAAISGASETRPEWGSGRYYVIDIDLADASGLKLKPGMSVRVESEQATSIAYAAQSVPAAAHPARASGEVYARTTAAISPPQIDDLWQLTITQMASEGQSVKKGDPIVSFDGGELHKNLTAKRSELEEKKRQQEKLLLELSEKGRSETLKTAEAHAETIKAQRKASLPESAWPGLDYKKFLIARRKAEQREAKIMEREQVAADERAAEQRAADGDVARLTSDVDRLQAALGALNLTAPRDGTFLHTTTPWDGEKIEVGKPVWRGVSVGEIPDMDTLAVRAALPERDLERARQGDSVRIVLEGGSGQIVTGKIVDIGVGVHSKSRVEPVPVVDLHIALDTGSARLKPGQPVQVEILDNAARLTSS